jgi:hypothetical protein
VKVVAISGTLHTTSRQDASRHGTANDRSAKSNVKLHVWASHNDVGHQTASHHHHAAGSLFLTTRWREGGYVTTLNLTEHLTNQLSVSRIR